MKNVSSLSESLAFLRRRFRYVQNRYFYNDKAELKARYKSITAWFLVYDEEHGYWIKKFAFYRKQVLPVSVWQKLWTRKTKIGGKSYESLFNIYRTAVLPAINEKFGTNWQFKTLIGWKGNDLPKRRDSDSSVRRNKTSKKVHAR